MNRTITLLFALFAIVSVSSGVQIAEKSTTRSLLNEKTFNLLKGTYNVK